MESGADLLHTYSLSYVWHVGVIMCFLQISFSKDELQWVAPMTLWGSIKAVFLGKEADDCWDVGGGGF